MNNSITLEDRILCDLEMILLGGFAPLNGFLNENDYNSVVENCRLCDGTVWPLPIVLPVGVKEHDKLQNEAVLTLKDKTGLPIARLLVESRWKPDIVRECELAYFGLVPELTGRGHGAWLMGHALKRTWREGIRRVWVHTCDLDHPGALTFYRRHSFRPYERLVEIYADPRASGLYPPETAPAVPLLRADT